MHYRFGAYTLDTQRYELRHAGQLVPLRPKVFHVLAYLLAQRDRVVSKDEVMAQVWPGQSISEETLSTCITAVRRAVADSGQQQQVIQTRHGHGYRFVAAVEVGGPPLLAPALPDVVHGPGLIADPLPEVPPSGSAAPTVFPTPPRQILPHALAGEHKVVTVLVGTLAPVTPGTQRQTAEAWHQALQAVLAAILEEIERYGGTLQSVRDDGFLALFGAPVAQEDHARRAVRAALGLLQRLRPGPGPLAGPSGEVDAVRLGLHTGPLLLGRLGAEQRLTYTAVGDTLQHAAWLARQAAPGTILVSAAIAPLVHGDVRLEARAPVPLPAQTDAVLAYEVCGLSPHRAPWLTDGARPRSRFVGRELELTTLQALLTWVIGGQGQVVGIVGEPGMGKTRLLTECWQRLGNTPVTWLAGRCVSYGQAIPYGPMQDLLRQACGLTEADSPAVITATVQQHLQALGMAPAEAAPVLLHLLGVADGAAPLVGRSPQEIRLQTFATLHQLLRQESQRQPLVVVVENLHWIDSTSEAYLTEVVERLSSVPLLLLVSFRPGYRPPWMDKSYATQLALPRLSPAESRGVVQAVLPPTPVSESLLQGMLTKAAGNPLFLEELAWAMREQGTLQLPAEVPDTIQAVLAARIDRLPPEAKRLLQVAAVIGPEVPVLLLQAIAALPDAVLHQTLAHLHAAEFLYETRLFPEHTYTFKHVLTHEVAYGSLLQDQRCPLHAQIVEAMEQLAPNRPADRVERLAHHALRGEVWVKALHYCRQAGAKAEVGSAYREAVTYYEQALEALQRLPENRDTLAQAIDLRFNLRSALMPLGAFGRIRNALHEAAALAERLDDPSRLGRVFAWLCDYHQHMGELDHAIVAGERAVALTTRLDDAVHQIRPRYHLGVALFGSGDYRRAVEVLSRTVDMLQVEVLSRTVDMLQGEQFRDSYYMRYSVYAGMRLAWGLAELGAFAEGIAHGEAAVRSAEAVNEAFALIQAYRGVGLPYLIKGDFQRAISAFERCLDLCQVWDVSLLFPGSAAPLGAAYARCGRVADALSLLEQSVARAASMGLQIRLADCTAYLSEAYFLAGHTEKAFELATHALGLSQAHQERGVQAWIYRLLGEIHAHCDPPPLALAIDSYRQALTLAKALSMRPLVAHCHHGLGRLYATTGQHEQASAELSTAIALYHAMDMTFWLPQAQAALAQGV